MFTINKCDRNFPDNRAEQHSLGRLELLGLDQPAELGAGIGGELPPRFGQRVDGTIAFLFGHTGERLHDRQRTLVAGVAVGHRQAVGQRRDRMAPSEEDHQELLRSIRDRGQIVPVLVRPHPTENGRYQIAFGHRRVRALKELSLKVKATVRNLTDEELVVAQGQENNARTNLSFIERARFAKQLEDRKFTREVISQSLCIDPGNLSRLISVASSIPLDIIDAIGPAPSIGQGRWMDLSASMDNRAHQKVRKAFTSDDFQRLSSDARFQFVLAQVKKTERAQTEAWTATDGLKVAKYTRGDKKFQLTLDEKLAPEFGTKQFPLPDALMPR